MAELLGVGALVFVFACIWIIDKSVQKARAKKQAAEGNNEETKQKEKKQAPPM